MLTFIPTPIGNLEDITIRALHCLKVANVILCEDTRIAKKLFNLLINRGFLESYDYVGMETKEFISFHSHNQDAFIDSANKDMFNKNVVFLSDAGMPCISDPGAKLVSYAIKNNIDFDILPGACAMNVAFCGSGSESVSFIFAGFLPPKRAERSLKLKRLANLNVGEAYSVICYESPHRILDTLEDIKLFLPHVSISVQKELTKIHQTRFYGNAESIISKLKRSELKGEWVITLDISQTQEAKDTKTLEYDDVLMLDIPPRVKAKILSKLSKKSVKQCYEEILSTESEKSDYLR